MPATTNPFLGKRLGPIIYEFNLSDALREGLVPKFTINHYGLSMTADERQRYEIIIPFHYRRDVATQSATRLTIGRRFFLLGPRRGIA